MTEPIAWSGQPGALHHKYHHGSLTLAACKGLSAKVLVMTIRLCVRVLPYGKVYEDCKKRQTQVVSRLGHGCTVNKSYTQ